MQFKAVFLTLVLIVFSLPIRPVQAQNPPLSPGCQEINTNPIYRNSTTAGANVAGPFNAGEQIRITLTNPTFGTTSANLGIVINTTISLAATSPVPGTLEYTIPVNYVDAVLLIIVSAFADADWVCGYFSNAFGDPNADVDGDGLPASSDNCPTIANRDQANGWGGAPGDACDTEFYDRGRGVKAFQVWRNGAKSALFEIYANCSDRTCERIAVLDFSSLPPSIGNAQGGLGPQDQAACAALADFSGLQNPALLAAQQECQRTSGGNVGWHVEAFDQGNGIWQVNIYDPAGTLQDDFLEVVVLGDGSVRWQLRR